jgi:hypothetical protein
MQSDFKLFTEWAESTAIEKTGQKREETASDRAMEVNSLGPKTLWSQGILAGRSLLERESLLAVVGGGRRPVNKTSPPRFQ